MEILRKNSVVDAQSRGLFSGIYTIGRVGSRHSQYQPHQPGSNLSVLLDDHNHIFFSMIFDGLRQYQVVRPVISKRANNLPKLASNSSQRWSDSLRQNVSLPPEHDIFHKRMVAPAHSSLVFSLLYPIKYGKPRVSIQTR